MVRRRISAGITDFMRRPRQNRPIHEGHNHTEGIRGPSTNSSPRAEIATQGGGPGQPGGRLACRSVYSVALRF